MTIESYRWSACGIGLITKSVFAGSVTAEGASGSLRLYEDITR